MSSLSRDRTAVVVALTLPPATSAVLVPFRSSLPNTDAALVLVAVIVAVAAFGNRIAGLVAAGSAAAWFDYFLTKPYEQFEIAHRADIETTVLLLLVGAAVTEIAVRGRRNQTLAAIDEAYLTAIRTATEAVGAGKQPAEVVADVTQQLTSLLGLRACRFERYQFGGLPRLQADGGLRWGESMWDVEHRGLPHRPIELLATSNGRAYGRFVLDVEPGTTPSPVARQVAAIVAGQVGHSLASQAHIDG